ncbi:hypothetical protein [Oceanobacter mangrovi]|nr:hypothetical protein [Oceanobacter mangrovi]
MNLQTEIATALIGLFKNLMASKAPGQDLLLTDSDVLGLLFLLDLVEQRV